MKQNYAVLGLIGLLVALVCSVQAIDRTFTIDEANLTSIRVAKDVSNSLMNDYWMNYTRST